MSSTAVAAVWVGSLNAKANEGHLNEQFQNYREFIVSIHVQRDKVTKESREFAFVNFNDRMKAAHAVQQINGKRFMGRRLKVDIKHEPRSSSAAASLATPKQLSRPQTLLPKDLDKPATLWVGSLHRKATEAELRDAFSAYRGSISSVRIMRDEKNKLVSRGFGFINFTCARHAEDALRNFQGLRVHGLPIKLSLKQTDTEMPITPTSPLELVPSQVSMAPVVRVIEKVSVL